MKDSVTWLDLELELWLRKKEGKKAEEEERKQEKIKFILRSCMPVKLLMSAVLQDPMRRQPPFCIVSVMMTTLSTPFTSNRWIKLVPVNSSYLEVEPTRATSKTSLKRLRKISYSKNPLEMSSSDLRKLSVKGFKQLTQGHTEGFSLKTWKFLGCTGTDYSCGGVIPGAALN
ncbi:uncharacterized protein [Gorilla gorilla gorilla]|uniref:uncharacterized protein n=1 Tax=Gorilla gorilla gorilla TaxID=9595 RepID=UPI0030097704